MQGQDLEAHVLLYQEDTAEIEALHATIRRELVLLSTQTHCLEFLEMSDRHCLRCARRQPLAYGADATSVVGIDFRSGDESEEDVVEPATKRRRVGAWRVYCSEQTFGKEGGCAKNRSQ